MKQYADVLIAWAQGKDVQFQGNGMYRPSTWTDYTVNCPPGITSQLHEWRIKPEPKPDVVYYENIYPETAQSLEVSERRRCRGCLCTIKITINGETGKVTAEVCE